MHVRAARPTGGWLWRAAATTALRFQGKWLVPTARVAIPWRGVRVKGTAAGAAGARALLVTHVRDTGDTEEPPFPSTLVHVRTAASCRCRGRATAGAGVGVPMHDGARELNAPRSSFSVDM